MKKIADITRLKSWKKLQELGFKKVKFTFQGLAYTIGAELTLKKPNGFNFEITLKHWNHSENYKGLDIRFNDHTYHKHCRYSLKPHQATKELKILIEKIEKTNFFTENLNTI